MNSIENEEAVRGLILMVGPENMRGDCVKPVHTGTTEEQQLVLETYHIGQGDKMTIVQPTVSKPLRE